ncbi:type III-A CRISPR-associated RAMP protein Csm3 [Microcoleus sp. AR_TQ3_B6]|uniref:type III-A CRISPR-associated RAMP protein Csm3 n=1 Tax=Microcoleus sp. AR_TQ3_B6 TaxID=3055284 RepID=UPI002FCF5797
MTGTILQKQLLGKLYITSTIEVETGLHIGGGEGKLDIGGIDKLVVRDPISEHPYIPGSSIKGKLRSILERFLNKPVNRESNDTWRYESDDLLDGFTEVKSLLIYYKGARTCELSRLFGSTGKETWVKKVDADADDITPPNPQTKKISINDYQGRQDEKGEQHVKVKGRNCPARLIVRDSHLQDESVKELKTINTGLLMTERKWENGLDRITSAATPRQFERVPKGAKFDLEMVYTIERKEETNKLTSATDSLSLEEQEVIIRDLENLAIALAILEDDALGGHGSRGYGKVKFQRFQLCYHDYNKIRGGAKDFIRPLAAPNNTQEFLKLFEDSGKTVQQFLLGTSQG